MKKISILSLLLSITLSSLAQQKIKECVIDNGVLKEVVADYNQSTGERTIVINGARKKFYEVYPKAGAGYAQDEKWYINNEEISFNGRLFVKYGLPRILGTNEIVKAGSYQNVGVYTEAGLTGHIEVIYIPVRQGCEFQPYQVNCGTVRIEKSSSMLATAKYTAKTNKMSGKISYSWSAGKANFSGQGTPSITFDTKTLKHGQIITLKVEAWDSRKCPVTDYYDIVINKSPNNNSKWTDDDRLGFMEECIKATKFEEDKALSYCSCMLEKIEVAHPSPVDLDKQLKNDVVEAWAKKCLGL